MTMLLPVRQTGGTLSVTITSDAALDVREFVVEQRLSVLFHIRLRVVSDDHAIDLDAVIGQPASFSIYHGMDERTWTGVCRVMELVRHTDDGLSTYDIVIVPWAWLLTQRRNQRMFQRLSEPEIACRILSDWGIRVESRLTETYKRREYRIQYGESDHALVCRMLEESGISYCFETLDNESTMVLTDAPGRREPRAGRLQYCDDVTLANGEYATQARVRREVCPGAFTLSDRDLRLAPTYPLRATVEINGRASVERTLEHHCLLPGAFLFEASKGDGTPLADDHGPFRSDEREVLAVAKKRLDAGRESAKVFSFETNALDIAPGMVVFIEGHAHPDFSQSLLIVASTLKGTNDGAWTHACEGRHAAIPYRPPLVTCKPRVAGTETAMVVGPHGEEIHTDELGRVRVHFFWDRESKMDENSSCWVQVAQGWAGAGFGTVHLPRVGQEVLVGFLGGDPDEPIIVGRLFTALQRVPYSLPANKTKSGIRTSSSPGGNGYNELMFEDKAGEEFIEIHAQRDMKTRAKRDVKLDVGRDRNVVVQHDDEVVVGRNAARNVRENAREAVGLHQSRFVGVNDVLDVGGDQCVTIAGSQTVDVGGACDVTIAGSMTATISGSRTETVGTTIQWTAGGAIEISNGAASITMDAGGKITLMGTEIAIVSSGPVNVSGTEVSVTGDTLEVLASGAAEMGGASLQLVGDAVETN